MLTIIKIISYTIPMFGNKLSSPYGKLLVSDGENEKVCTIKFDKSGREYITFKHKRNYIKNTGNLYSPNYVFAN